MRILQLNGSKAFAGAEQSTLTISHHMGLRGHDVHLAVRRGSLLAERARALGLNVFETPAYDRMPLQSLRNYVREHRIDVLHAHLFRAIKLGLWTSWLSGAPLVTHARVNKKSAIYRWAARRGRLVAVSRSTEQYYREVVGVSPEHTRVIINATRVQEREHADLDRAEAHAGLTEEMGLPAKTRLVGLFARLTRQKGQDILVEALPAIRARVPNAHVVLIGPAHDRAALPFVDQVKKRVSELSLEQHVTFLGQRTDIARLLRGLDVAVVPSRYDPCPNTVMEATMLGTPLVAARVGGIPEQLDGDRLARIVESEDVPGTAAAVADVLEDGAEATAMAARAQAHARRLFSPTRLMEEIEEVYEQVLAQRAR